jgi:hypothetical protein
MKWKGRKCKQGYRRLEAAGEQITPKTVSVRRFFIYIIGFPKVKKRANKDIKRKLF